MKTGFIGAGNMGGAILRGYIASGASVKDIYVVGANKEKLRKLAVELGVNPVDTVEEVVRLCHHIIVGVKPNTFPEVMQEIAKAYSPEKLVTTMAAGISLEYMEGFLGKDAKVVRIMPNTPAMVGEGMTAVCRNKNVDDLEFAEVMDIFRGIGRAVEVGEDLMHCVIGVSGSSPAYTYMFIEALVEAAVKNGMSREQALVFAGQSVLGAAKMVLETGIDPGQLRINVCSPGGTTIEAVNSLNSNGFSGIVEKGFQAAVDKSKLMSR